MRRCQKCKDLKLLNEFFVRNKERKLKSTYCKTCFQQINNEYKKNNPITKKEISKREYQKNKRNYLNSNYKRKYGISHDEYDEIVKKQEGVCYICNLKPKTKLFIDHCHSTGKIRDLLCGNCNRLIGESKENIQVLLNAIKYLQKHLSIAATLTNITNQ
jgi:hypothetical protein